MINVALFGFGRIGQMHAENLTKNKEIKLLYVYEKIDELSNKAKKLYGCKIEKNYNNISVYLKENNGVSSALNYAVEKIKTKYFLQISPDLEFNFEDLNIFLDFEQYLHLPSGQVLFI